MAWFRKEKKRFRGQPKRQAPDGLWLKCNECGEIIYRQELARNFWVCSKCRYHFPISASHYLSILMDEGTFEEKDAGIVPMDPLGFRDSKKYKDRLRENMEKTGLREAIITGVGKINERDVSIGVMDFGFMGGSMGSVVGEKVARCVRRAIEGRIPLVIISKSGGARMQEGILSLMQMAKTSSWLARLSDERIPFISILTHPTTGGVSASFAFLGDVILAEPKALVGFAGPRVIQQTIGQELPEGFQLSEFMLEHGFIDIIVNRNELKKVISKLLTFMSSNEDKGLP
ncbi:MAG: acetyl-CoA carboxylase, carboxyltransferase subunit beta [Candidatus Glassbacteria bacterium]